MKEPESGPMLSMTVMAEFHGPYWKRIIASPAPV